MDTFRQGLMLGEVLAISKHTASKVDTIEARQAGLIQRIERLESAPSPSSSPRKLALAVMAAVAAGIGNLQAEQVATIVRTLLRGAGSH
jgi:hypothetical protein